jgi:hypothetical protein
LVIESISVTTTEIMSWFSVSRCITRIGGMINPRFRVVSRSLADVMYPLLQLSRIDALIGFMQGGRSESSECTSSDDTSQPYVRDSHPWPSLAVLSLSAMSLPDLVPSRSFRRGDRDDGEVVLCRQS